jgi:hypothetical protein
LIVDGAELRIAITELVSDALDYAFRNSLIVSRSPAPREDRRPVETEKQLVLLDQKFRLDCHGRLFVSLARGRPHVFLAVE